MRKKIIYSIIAITSATLIIGYVGVKKINSSTIVKVDVASPKKEVFIREVDGSTYNEESLNIMGYEPLDYAQAMSFVLTKAKSSPYTIEDMDFNGITLEEHIVNLNKVCYLENINPGVMLSQQVLETSIFIYKHQKPDKNGNIIDAKSVVKPSDYNYAGIGAVDKGNGCNSFKDNYEGQLAQAQHLKAYASTDELNTPLVDPRFKYVERGKAKTLSGLSEEWASNKVYGEHIARLYTELMNHEIDEELVKKYQHKIY